MYKWKSNVINIKEKIYSAYELGMVEIHAGLNERPYLGKIYKILSSKITFLCSEEFYAQLYHIEHSVSQMKRSKSRKHIMTSKQKTWNAHYRSLLLLCTQYSLLTYSIHFVTIL